MRVPRRISSGLVFILAAGAFAMAQGQMKQAPQPGLTLTTSAFPDGGEIPTKYTQASSSPVSPALEWSHVPPNTESFVLIMHDPEAVDNRKTEDHLHWLLVNIPADVRHLPEGVKPTPGLPDGTIQCKNVGGVIGYRGPGAGAAGPYHHYTWELFALNTKLDLGPDATRTQVLNAMEGHILGKGALVGRFHR